MTGSWFALAIVILIMYSLFKWAWWGVIPIVAVAFGALTSTLEYFNVRSQVRKETLIINQNANKVIVNSNPPINNASKIIAPKFCPFCGKELADEVKICGSCGSNLSLQNLFKFN